MDPVSIAGLVASLLGVAIKCSVEVKDCISDLRNAPDYIATTATILKDCNATVRRLLSVYGQPILECDPDVSALESPLEEIERISRKVRDILQPYLVSRGQRKLGTWRRIRWLWVKRRIHSLREELGVYRNALNTALTERVDATTQRMRDGDARRDVNIDQILREIQNIQRRLRAASTVSDEEQRELVGERDRLEDQLESRLEAYIRYAGSYADPEEARSPPSSVAGLSPRASRVVSPMPQSLNAVLSSDSLRAQPENPVSATRDNEVGPATANSATQKTDQAPSNTFGKSWDQPTAHLFRQPKTAPGANVVEEPKPPTPMYDYQPNRTISGDRKEMTRRMTSHPAPEIHSVQSAPGLLEITQGMNDDEARAFISGHLHGIDTRIEQFISSKSAQPLNDQAYQSAEQRDLQLAWAELLLRNHEIQQRQIPNQLLLRNHELQRRPIPNHRNFPVHRDEEFSEATTAVLSSRQRSSSQPSHSTQDLIASTDLGARTALQPRPTNTSHTHKASASQLSDEDIESTKRRRRRARSKQSLVVPADEKRKPFINQSGMDPQEAVRSSTRAALESQQWAPPTRPRTTTRR